MGDELMGGEVASRVGPTVVTSANSNTVEVMARRARIMSAVTTLTGTAAGVLVVLPMGQPWATLAGALLALGALAASLFGGGDQQAIDKATAQTATAAEKLGEAFKAYGKGGAK